MTTIATQARYTPDDLLRLENEGLYELVDGQLVEKPMGTLATKTVIIVSAKLLQHLEATQGGEIYSEQSFRCFPHEPDLIRRPDVSVIVAGRLGDVSDEGHVTIAPDLAIEVVSPNDVVYELDEKLADYRAAGVKSVWVLNPKSRVLRAHRSDGDVVEFTKDDDVVSGDPVLPGFSVKLGELLPAPKLRK